MIAIIQRVLAGEVVVGPKRLANIDQGLVVLAAIVRGDTDDDLDWMCRKIATLRIFRSADGDKHFDRDVTEVGGGVLLVSNFTVAGATAKGRRPSLDAALPPEEAQLVFGRFVAKFKAVYPRTMEGAFGADMKVTLTNDGPVTFILDSNVR